MRQIFLIVALLINIAAASLINAQPASAQQQPEITQFSPGIQQQQTNPAPGELKNSSSQQIAKKSEPIGSKQLIEWLDGWTLSEKIAGIASLAAFLQFIALLATILITVRNGRRQLRAYIGVTAGELPTLQLGHKQRGGIVLTNHGQTPAFKVKYRGERLFLPMTNLLFQNLELT